MKLAVVLLLQITIIAQSESKSNANNIADHYWRDYTGRIPADAIEAGKDKSGNPIYIAIAGFINFGYLPGTIHLGSNSVKVTASCHDCITDKNIKILCSQQPEKYRWVPIEINQLHLLAKCTLVPGGFEGGSHLYIGRGFHEMEMQVGKVYPDSSVHKGLYLPYSNREAKYRTYEILTYGCSAKQKCKCR